jgi:hypothetical protein
LNEYREEGAESVSAPPPARAQNPVASKPPVGAPALVSPNWGTTLPVGASGTPGHVLSPGGDGIRPEPSGSNSVAKSPRQLRAASDPWEFGQLSGGRSPAGSSSSTGDAGRLDGNDADSAENAESLDKDLRLLVEERSREFAVLALHKMGFVNSEITQMPQLNEGFDIEVKRRDDRPLRIELKGHLGTERVVELSAPQFEAYMNALKSDANYEWQLWSVQNLASDFKHPVKVLRFESIPTDALTARTYRVKLDLCRAISEGINSIQPEE